MARPCSLCGRPDLAAIEAAMSVQPLRKIAARYGTSTGSLSRHRSEHMAQRATADAPVAESVSERAQEPVPERTDDASWPQEDPPRRFRTRRTAIMGAIAEDRCIDLRIAGKTYREIAAELGISAGGAFAAVDRVLTRTRAEADEKADAARQIDLERVDRLIGALWERATDPAMVTVDVPADNEAGVRAYDGQDKAADRLLKALERRAKLLGLDVPVEKTTINIVNRPEFSAAMGDALRVVARVLDCMYPGASADVGAGLQAWQAGGSKALDAWLMERAYPVLEASE